jgi:Hemerythrin HHE cation binding domain
VWQVDPLGIWRTPADRGDTIMITAPVAGPLVPTDVVDVLVEQHDGIRRAVAAVEAATGQARDAALRELAELIEAHEDVEARLVHPVAEHELPGGRMLAHTLVVEENRADELLSQLITLGSGDARFASVFAEFRTVILEHLRREEREEFAALRARTPREVLVELGVRAQENRLWL